MPADVGAERRGGEQQLWLITMTDMYILLMSLFVLLFAMGLADRPTGVRTTQRLQGPPGPSELPPVGAEGLEFVNLPEGQKVIIGGELSPFAEGSWELLPAHRQTIAALKRWLQGKMNVILVRGHTAGNWFDSVVMDGGTIRPFTEADNGRPDRDAIANPWLLATLRADAVRAALLAPDPPPPVDERRIRVQGDAFTAPLPPKDSEDERTRRARNRRVEIIVTNELISE
jgi:flagellar motor protein MotB